MNNIVEVKVEKWPLRAHFRVLGTASVLGHSATTIHEPRISAPRQKIEDTIRICILQYLYSQTLLLLLDCAIPLAIEVTPSTFISLFPKQRFIFAQR